MITYEDLVQRAEYLERLLDILEKRDPDLKDADEILRPLIKKVLRRDTDLPIKLPMQTFFYRQDNSLPKHDDFMNAVAKFDIGLERLNRNEK